MNQSAKFIPVIVLLLVLGLVSTWCFKSVPAGHVSVATLFGKVVNEPYRPGLHFPVNPLYRWTDYDARQKTHMETAEVPSQDQLTTKIDVSVQYRLKADMAPSILAETGTAEQVISVHLIPKLRSALREQGKTIKRAEDFFLEETQNQLQSALLEQLEASLTDKGVEVTEVLIRDITLPQFIKQAIERKKEREQEAERQKAELERFRTEQQQLIAEAEAKRQAAEEEAQQRRLLADAQAYEIEKINEAIANNPAYIQLQALDALKAISKDPAAKVYFLNSDAPMPLPLMHMGDMNQP
ncbi:MAG: prohibitin family protein [Gammaproteobacteria bacterium]|nr:MAG: prohibitin family protein [Gammaproteobacteria bacterium]